MIRRSPCELYIKFLLVHPSGFNYIDVRNKLHEMGLDYPNDAYIARLQRNMDVPSPFRPMDLGHLPSQRFLMAQGLKGFFFPDEASKLAHELVKSPRAKELIESMVLVDEPPAVIVHMVKELGERCTADALRRYCAYYWDLSLVDSVELRALLTMRTEYLVHRDDGEEVSPQERLQHSALKRAAYKDPRRMVSEMPIAPMAGLLNRMRMGYMPTQIDLTRLAGAARVAAASRVWGAAMDFSPRAATEARDFAVVVQIMTALITEVGSPDTELQRELQQLALQTDDFRPPTIHQLSAGHHTVDLQPVVEAEGAEVEPTDG